MACEGCNTKSKILFGVGGLLGLIGFILFIVAVTTGSESVKVGYVAENAKDPTVTAESGKGELGFAVHFEASKHSNCESISSATTITPPSGSNPLFFGTCNEAQSDWEKDNDPPLRKLGHFFINENAGVKVFGGYKISCTANVWVVDSGEELGEAVGGIFAAMGIFVVGIILCIIGCILCCVGCCCMDGKNTEVVVAPGAAQPVQVVGAPKSGW